MEKFKEEGRTKSIARTHVYIHKSTHCVETLACRVVIRLTLLTIFLKVDEDDEGTDGPVSFAVWWGTPPFMAQCNPSLKAKQTNIQILQWMEKKNDRERKR